MDIQYSSRKINPHTSTSILTKTSMVSSSFPFYDSMLFRKRTVVPLTPRYYFALGVLQKMESVVEYMLSILGHNGPAEWFIFGECAGFVAGHYKNCPHMLNIMITTKGPTRYERARVYDPVDEYFINIYYISELNCGSIISILASFDYNSQRMAMYFDENKRLKVVTLFSELSLDIPLSVKLGYYRNNVMNPVKEQCYTRVDTADVNILPFNVLRVFQVEYNDDYNNMLVTAINDINRVRAWQLNLKPNHFK